MPEASNINQQAPTQADPHKKSRSTRILIVTAVLVGLLLLCSICGIAFAIVQQQSFGP